MTHEKPELHVIQKFQRNIGVHGWEEFSKCGGGVRFLVSTTLIAILVALFTEILQLRAEPDFRAVNLSWEYPKHGTNFYGFQIHYCELQAWGPNRCRTKVIIQRTLVWNGIENGYELPEKTKFWIALSHWISDLYRTHFVWNFVTPRMAPLMVETESR